MEGRVGTPRVLSRLFLPDRRPLLRASPRSSEENFWGDVEAITQPADVFLAQSSLPA